MSASTQRIIELRKEAESREKEGVRIYRPHAGQEPIHRSGAVELLCSGGKRCISGDSLVYDPVAEIHRRVDEITEPFWVESKNPATGELIAARAEVPFTKGEDEFFLVSLSNGESFKATGQHLLLSCDGWRSLHQLASLLRQGLPALLATSSGTSHGGFPRDAVRSTQKAPGCLDDCCQSSCRCDEQPRASQAASRAFPPSQVDALECTQRHWRSGGPVGRREYTQPCLLSGHLSILCAQGQTSGHEVASGTHGVCTPCSPASMPGQGVDQSPQRSCGPVRTTSASPRQASRSASACEARHHFVQGCTGYCSKNSQFSSRPRAYQVQTGTDQLSTGHQTCSSCAPFLLAEVSNLSIVSICSVGKETVWDFSVPATGNYCMAGAVHHNSGKSVSVACEFARRVTGIPICDEQGKTFPAIWPQANPEYPRIYWVIGWDTNHLGQTIHRLLFQPGMGGQFRCIQDEVTGKWRAWNRANPIDAKRVKESALTEPLIPDRMIVPDSWEWEDKRGNQFRHVELKNGAKIYAYPSTARNPKQGDAVSGIWIDEDIVYPDHLKEWQDRLTDERGFLLWSVWPHMKNEALLTLIERAEMAALHDNPRIERVSLTMTDNPYITQEGKDQALERMGSDEEIARRNRGDLMMDSLSMYPFDSSVHSIKPRNPDLIYEPLRSDAYNKLREVMEMLGGFPEDWTRYLAMDPSHTRTGIHSWVVPPHNVDGIVVGDLMICEWEIVAKRLTAAAIAREVKNRMLGRRYEAFIMDMRAGRQTHAGRDSNTLMFFSEAFRTEGLTSRQSGYSFLPGCDVPSTRFRSVRDLMEIQPRIGIPSLMIVEGKCPETKKEFTKYRKKREARGTDADSVLDEPANPRLYDCMAAMEYAATHIQRLFMQSKAYVSPDVYKGQGSAAYRHVQDIMRKHENQNENGVVCLGAGNYTSSY